MTHESMDEADSVMNSDSGLDTNWQSGDDEMSVTSSNYIWRNKEGRTYHAFQDKPYDFPSDEHEASRLDGLHDLTKVLFHKNVLAPIEDRPGTKILDLGTGSGKWAIEVADEYPHAIVHGIDLAPIQPTYIPLNCSFYVADIILDLEAEKYPDGSIDLVHMRYIHSGIRKEEWPPLLLDIYRMLKPGNGWVQLGEAGGFDTSKDPPSSCIVWQFLEYHRENEERKGKPYLSAEAQRQFVQDAGFVDIQVIQKWCDHGTYTDDPVAKRAGVIGRYAHGSLWPVIGTRLTQIEDVDERRAFSERALTALCSGTEPLGVLKDVSNYRLLLMDLDIRL